MINTFCIYIAGIKYDTLFYTELPIFHLELCDKQRFTTFCVTFFFTIRGSTIILLVVYITIEPRRPMNLYPLQENLVNTYNKKQSSLEGVTICCVVILRIFSGSLDFQS